MADGRPTVLIALADRRRAEELAAHLAESEAMIAVLADEVEPGGPSTDRFDAVVSDDPARRQQLPTVLLADASFGAIAGGAARAVLRPAAGDPLIAAAIRLVAAGYSVVRRDERPALARTAADDTELSLTYREREVIALLAEGASNKLIARRLDISVHTAKFHVAAILEKLGAVNRTDAIAIAMREGLVLV